MMVLTTIVEVSNVFSVLIVFLVFCAMVVFILRLQSEDFRMTSVTFAPKPSVTHVPMLKIHNPFVFNLKPCHQTLNDVICCVSSQVPWTLQALWGVSINDLHTALREPWTVLEKEITSQKFLHDSCLQQGSLQYYSECKDMLLHITTDTDISNEDLGRSPRTKYPLVVILLRQDGGTTLEDHRVGAMVAVIHIQDDLCKMQSCVLAQYLKMSDGQLSTLQQLYVASDEEHSENAGLSESGAEPSESKDERDVICVVCQSTSATRALLPCRHVCTCWKCFRHLDKCPMCRSPIHSYFCIREEENEVENSELDPAGQRPLNWRHRFEEWNDWLNHLLGL